MKVHGVIRSKKYGVITGPKLAHIVTHNNVSLFNNLAQLFIVQADSLN